MANKKTTDEEVFYIVMTEEYPLESGDSVSVQNSLEKAYIDTVEAWSHEGGDKYIAYEVKKLGYVKITTEK